VTVCELCELARLFKPTILCVLETQLHKTRVEGLARQLGYDRAFSISSSGRSGGLVMFWNNDIKLEILPYSQNHLDAVITKKEVIPRD
jgi:hypothetical protein